MNVRIKMRMPISHRSPGGCHQWILHAFDRASSHTHLCVEEHGFSPSGQITDGFKKEPYYHTVH